MGDEEAPKQAAQVPVSKKAKDQEYVEYCSGWMVAGITEDDTPEIKIDMLTEGYKYQFRVKAQNKAGFSYPSESTEEIVAKMRKQKPQIERVNMPKSAVMVKGDNLTMKVKVQGEPITDKSWFWGRREIKASGSVNIENTDYMSRITIFALERADTGTFSFRAENEHGMAESSLELVVQVAPNEPREVERTGCSAGVSLLLRPSARWSDSPRARNTGSRFVLPTLKESLMVLWVLTASSPRTPSLSLVLLASRC